MIMTLLCLTNSPASLRSKRDRPAGTFTFTGPLERFGIRMGAAFGKGWFSLVDTSVRDATVFC